MMFRNSIDITREVSATTIRILTSTFQRQGKKYSDLRLKTGLCLLLACLGASWFAYQLLLIPQPETFAPDWQGAQWIQASDGNNSVACFRYVTDLAAVPGTAFVTITASQVFRLYVNGTFIGTNSNQFTEGQGVQAYMFDIASALTTGNNVLGVRVANLDKKNPALRASFGFEYGTTTSYIVTDNHWQATTQDIKIYPGVVHSQPIWTSPAFDASTWPQSSILPAAPTAPAPMLLVNPELYEHPMPDHWMGIGTGHEAFFVRQFTIPTWTSHVWLRLVATGPASIFLNGRLATVWNGQVPITQQNPADYLSDNYLIDPNAVVPYNAGLALGVYDISPYLHAGTNTIALHVTSPGTTASQVGLATLSTALSADLLVTAIYNHPTWIDPNPENAEWHTSNTPIANWEQAGAATLSWPAPLSIGRPGLSQMVYLPGTDTSRNINIPPLTQIMLIGLVSSAAVLGLWLLMSLRILRPFYYSNRAALAELSLAYMPALAGECLLIVLGRESLIPQPFPYTWLWGGVLLTLVASGYLLLWQHAKRQPKQLAIDMMRKLDALHAHRSVKTAQITLSKQCLLWLYDHWVLLLIILASIPLICYNLNYEPYWQDELTSYYAAKGVLLHGLPLLPSGFLYAKGELYSYLLALSIAIFGEQNGALRLVSVAAYLFSLPLFYKVATYLFDKRVALLATAMLAFSPMTLTWGRGVRMYELAQFLTIFVMYLFYRALHERHHPYLVYLAISALVITYFSHEEVFIIFPMLTIYALVTSCDHFSRLPWVLTNKHWLIASTIGGSIIVTQLAVVHFTHPPVLGTDPSQQPFIEPSTENISYYIKLMFFPLKLNKTLPFITINSLTALLGCIWAFYRGDERAKYCATFFLLSFATLAGIFTLTANRYLLPLLPAFYALSAYGLLSALNFIWQQGQSPTPPFEKKRPVSTPFYSIRPKRILIQLVTTLLCSAILLAPVLPISGYDLFTSRVLGITYHRHFSDYDTAGAYVQAHERPGDIVISVSPAISILYYVGHVDYFFSVDRALYLFQRNAHITDTPTGSTPLLSQDDFLSVLSSHARVWIVTDQSLYEAEAKQGNRFIFPPDFRLVYSGYGSAVYVRLN
jgi:hypothetical protein